MFGLPQYPHYIAFYMPLHHPLPSVRRFHTSISNTAQVYIHTHKASIQILSHRISNPILGENLNSHPPASAVQVLKCRFISEKCMYAYIAWNNIESKASSLLTEWQKSRLLFSIIQSTFEVCMEICAHSVRKVKNGKLYT